MSVEAWLATFGEPIAAAELTNPAATAIVTFMTRFGEATGTFVRAHRRGTEELVILDLRTGAPQRPVYPLLPTERVGLFFPQPTSQPHVAMLRDDFPDTEHQQLVPVGYPAIICIDDRSWAEARLTWTPAELIERVLSWFHRAARGELHDARQPIDPLFLRPSLTFLIARSTIAGDQSQDLLAEHDPEYRNVLRVRPTSQMTPSQVTPSHEPLSIAAYAVRPQLMKRFRYAPDNLNDLATMLEERGIDLLGDLTKRLNAWIAEGRSAAWKLRARFAVIAEMPVVAPSGEQRDGLDHRAFITDSTAGDIAVALGIAESASDHSKVGYVKKLLSGARNVAALSAIKAQMAEVLLELEPDLAARLGGRTSSDSAKAVLVGAGTVGSHIADCLVREGRFSWTIIDDDRVLPHNLARHVATGGSILQPKAKFVAGHINAILPHRGSFIAANVLEQGSDGQQIEKALTDAELIIDATASLVAARFLADYPVKGRRASVFFNPPGDAAVLLAEPPDRSLSLRDLEAQYLRLILRTERLSEHLSREAETVAYTGACRALTNKIPQSRASLLSGLLASGLARATDSHASVISVWTVEPSGDIARDTVEPRPVLRFAVEDWQITVDAGLLEHIRKLRHLGLPNETGGILFGLVDIPAKRIHLVDATSAPSDSSEQATGFVRGVHGVDQLMKDVRRKTGGQVRYVGEWHSHPPNASALPSAVDGEQIDWLSALMQMDSMPALMVIVADETVSVIFANRPATPLSETQAGDPVA